MASRCWFALILCMLPMVLSTPIAGHDCHMELLSRIELQNILGEIGYTFMQMKEERDMQLNGLFYQAIQGLVPIGQGLEKAVEAISAESCLLDNPDTVQILDASEMAFLAFNATMRDGIQPLVGQCPNGKELPDLTFEHADGETSLLTFLRQSLAQGCQLVRDKSVLRWDQVEIDDRWLFPSVVDEVVTCGQECQASAITRSNFGKHVAIEDVVAVYSAIVTGLSDAHRDRYLSLIETSKAAMSRISKGSALMNQFVEKLFQYKQMATNFQEKGLKILEGFISISYKLSQACRA